MIVHTEEQLREEKRARLCPRSTATELLALRAMLREADLQLEYLDGRWPTGTTPAVRGGIKKLLRDGQP